MKTSGQPVIWSSLENSNLKKRVQKNRVGELNGARRVGWELVS
jgi:hypothetical protein